MNRSETITDLAAALSKAQAKIEGAVKDKSNPAFRSKYADLGACWDAIREPLSSNGLSIVQFPRTLDGAVEVETILMHSTGQYISDVFAIPVSKRDAHGYMSATTYARRGALMAVAGIAPVDDDGNGATGRQDDRKDDPIAQAKIAAVTEDRHLLVNGEERSTYDVEKAKKWDTWVSDQKKLMAKATNEDWWHDPERKKNLERLRKHFPEKYDDLEAAFNRRLDQVEHAARSVMAAG